MKAFIEKVRDNDLLYVQSSSKEEISILKRES